MPIFKPVKNINIIPVNILVHDEALVQTKNFVYMESTITHNARLDSKVTFRMGKVGATYGKL